MRLVYNMNNYLIHWSGLSCHYWCSVPRSIKCRWCCIRHWNRIYSILTCCACWRVLSSWLNWWLRRTRIWGIILHIWKVLWGSLQVRNGRLIKVLCIRCRTHTCSRRRVLLAQLRNTIGDGCATDRGSLNPSSSSFASPSWQSSFLCPSCLGTMRVISSSIPNRITITTNFISCSLENIFTGVSGCLLQLRLLWIAFNSSRGKIRLISKTLVNSLCFSGLGVTLGVEGRKPIVVIHYVIRPIVQLLLWKRLFLSGLRPTYHSKVWRACVNRTALSSILSKG